jgi:hypothetical protein
MGFDDLQRGFVEHAGATIAAAEALAIAVLYRSVVRTYERYVARLERQDEDAAKMLALAERFSAPRRPDVPAENTEATPTGQGGRKPRGGPAK